MARGAPTPAVRALDAAGAPYQLHSFSADATTGSYGEAAAAALGVEPGRVFKTLVTEVTGGPGPAVVAIVAVNGRLDLRALATALGAKRAEMAEPRLAERLTGYVVGGISPFGQRRALRTVLDRSAEGFATVFVSGGRRGLEIELAPADLLRATQGSWAAISSTAT